MTTKLALKVLTISERQIYSSELKSIWIEAYGDREPIPMADGGILGKYPNGYLMVKRLKKDAMEVIDRNLDGHSAS